ncbi:unnamed protein product [Gongylonema pulchrum]|uniref:AMP-binding domain-containing protein n=1 Tax=Gongylonema pulchrum TaxID=637853 RepID=A0A183D2X0_9BILA|nr:unnamed protein product [Gongylonema pulchrum]
MNKVKCSYGWLGTKCISTVNYRLEEGEIVTADEEGILSDLMETGGCQMNSGYCAKQKSVVIWNALQLSNNCVYEQRGSSIAYIKGKHVIMEEFQATLVFKEIAEAIKEICGLINPHLMENDVILTSDDRCNRNNFPMD